MDCQESRGSLSSCKTVGSLLGVSFRILATGHQLAVARRSAAFRARKWLLDVVMILDTSRRYSFGSDWGRTVDDKFQGAPFQTVKEVPEVTDPTGRERRGDNSSTDQPGV